MNIIGLVTVTLIFSVPIIAIITDHLSSQNKLKAQMLKDQLELEKIKQENFITETEKLKLELHKMETEMIQDSKKIL